MKERSERGDVEVARLGVERRVVVEAQVGAAAAAALLLRGGAACLSIIVQHTRLYVYKAVLDTHNFVDQALVLGPSSGFMD